MAIRELETKDIESSTRLYKQLYPEYAARTIDLTRGSFSSQYIPLIYEDNGESLGLIVGTILSFGRTTLGYIEDLVVDTTHRGQGIGKQLVLSLLQVFKTQNVEVVFVATDFKNEEENPIPFYEKLGFRTTVHPWLVTVP